MTWKTCWWALNPDFRFISFWSNLKEFYVQSLLSRLRAHISCYTSEAGYKWDDVQHTLCEAWPKGSKVVSFLYINELIPVTMRGLEVFIIFSNSSSFLLANIPNHELYKCILLFQQQRTLTQALQRNVSLSYSNCFSVSRSHQHV